MDTPITKPATNPIIQPIIDDLKGSQPPLPDPGPAKPPKLAPPATPTKPRPPAELDQDPGSGYNADHTYPQD
jgi:hypothetical protein